MMTFEQAVEVVKAYAHNGLLLDGLYMINEELDNERDDEDSEYMADVTSEQRMAYYLVVREMRPLFA